MDCVVCKKKRRREGPAALKGAPQCGRLVAVIAATWRWWRLVVIIPLSVSLILSIADHVAANATGSRADCCAFETAAGLVTNNATSRRATESA